jgi:DNA relaxase NicK
MPKGVSDGATRFPEIGVDYITLTTKSQKQSTVMLALAHPLAKSEAKRGNLVKCWAMSGFNGFAVGQLQFGMRDNEAIVRLSGSLAALEWFDFYQRSDNVTRIDLQVTERLGHDPTIRVLQEHKATKRFAKLRSNQLRVALWCSNDGGATCYLGSRQSNLFARIYNKAVESGIPQYQNCVRYELEVKGRMTKPYLQDLTSGKQVGHIVFTRVKEFITKRGGVCPRWPETQPTTLCWYQKSTDLDRKLSWLRNAVRDSVSILREHGREREALSALGLQDFCGPSSNLGQVV